MRVMIQVSEGILSFIVKRVFVQKLIIMSAHNERTRLGIAIGEGLPNRGS